MGRVINLPAGVQFRVMYWDDTKKKVEVVDPACHTYDQAVRIAEGLEGKYSNHNIEILSLVSLIVVHEGPDPYLDTKGGSA